MRTLKRNRRRFFYSLYRGEFLLYDDYGYETGELDQVYSVPVECWANISAAKGEVSTEQFGINESYDKVIVMDKDLGIEESSALWIDSVTKSDDAYSISSKPQDYIVVKIAKSLNFVSLAVKKVKLTGTLNFGDENNNG